MLDGSMDALRRLSRTTLAAATAVLIFVALLFGYVLDVTSNEEGEGDVRGWLIVSAVASVLAAALLLRFVPATESDGDAGNKPARRGLVLGVLSVIALAVFWTGLPFVLGVPGLVLAAEGRARAPQQGRGGEATAAAVLASVAIVAAFVVCVVGSAASLSTVHRRAPSRARASRASGSGPSDEPRADAERSSSPARASAFSGS